MVSRKKARNESIKFALLLGVVSYIVMTNASPLASALVIAGTAGVSAYIGMDPK